METSFEKFARGDSSISVLAPAVLVLVPLLVLLILSAIRNDWFVFGLVLISMAAATICFIALAVSRQRLSARSDHRRLDWVACEPDVQRENLNVEVAELARVLQIEPEQESDLQSAYIVAEDLALRQIQQEENVPILRHVSLGATPFDAILVKNDIVCCIDLSFLVVPDLRQEKIDAVFKRMSTVKKHFDLKGVKMRLRLMIVLVTQLTVEDDERLRSTLSRKRFEQTPVESLEIRFLDFESLQRIYVTD